jgi:cell surface protein SprA
LNGNFFPQYNIPLISINEQLSPLIGIDIAFKKPRLTTKIEYKIGRTLGMSLIDYQLVESKNKSFTLGAGYKIKGLNLKFIKIKGKPLILQNDVNFKLDFSITDNKTTNRKLDQDIDEPTRGTFTWRIAPSIDYMINNKLNVRLFYDRTFNRPIVSNSFPITNTRGGITIRFTLGQ